MPFVRRLCIAAIVAVLGTPLLLSQGCSNAPAPGVTLVSPADAQALIEDRLNDPNFVILDVRNPEEFAGGHIAGAVNLCFRCDTFLDELAALDKSKTYLVYCASDNRSGQATAEMARQGFTSVYDLDGGITRWKAEGLPVVQ